MTKPISISELERLERAATPGPWEPCLGSGNNECTAIHWAGDDHNPFGIFVCDLVPDWLLEKKYAADLKWKPANMEFLAASRNALPELIAALRLAVGALKHTYCPGGAAPVISDTGEFLRWDPHRCCRCDALAEIGKKIRWE